MILKPNLMVFDYLYCGRPVEEIVENEVKVLTQERFDELLKKGIERERAYRERAYKALRVTPEQMTRRYRSF
jgi:hypothetical protein